MAPTKKPVGLKSIEYKRELIEVTPAAYEAICNYVDTNRTWLRLRSSAESNPLLHRVEVWARSQKEIKSDYNYNFVERRGKAIVGFEKLLFDIELFQWNQYRNGKNPTETSGDVQDSAEAP